MPVNFYRRIPRIVRALQFILTDTFEAELREFSADQVKLRTNEGTPLVEFKQAEFTRRGFPGDWIVELKPGEFGIYQPETFALIFEPFPAPPSIGWQAAQVQALNVFAQRKLELRQAIVALYGQVPEAVADDVKRRFANYEDAADQVLALIEQTMGGTRSA